MTFELPNGMGTVRTTKLSKHEGDCSITMMRAKKKHLFDFAFTLDWAVRSFPGNVTRCPPPPSHGQLSALYWALCLGGS